VYGYASASTGNNTIGVHGVSGSVSGAGVYGANVAGSGFNSGVYGESSSPNGYGVKGVGAALTGKNYGVFGVTNSPSGYAGWFVGNVVVTGELTKGGGSFKIDHPLDPKNKYLSHSFVESSDMMNIYNGNVVLDKNGEAWVELPEWFEALNRDFRYQLTCIGGFAPVFVAQEIKENKFKVAGGTPGMKVSWQVTGIRKDPYALAHSIKVEEEKPVEEQGYYLHPVEWGQPKIKSIECAHNPEAKWCR
jgi:hypothetical protein